MKKNILLFIFSFFLVISCKKHLTNKPGLPPPPVPSKDSWIAGINREIAAILEEVYRNDSAYKEVNAAIFSEYYADERVLLKDLLQPENSDLYKTSGFRKFNVPAGVFKRHFNEVLAAGQYPLLNDALAQAISGQVVAKTAVLANSSVLSGTAGDLFSGISAAAIYFPYSTNFSTGGTAGTPNIQSIKSATIVAAEEEANSAPGRSPYSCGSSIVATCYKNVIVDDKYANSMPTHIVENGARPKIALVSNSGTGDKITRVYLGWAKLTRQMDALISFTGNGGGSEIKVARITGYLKKEGEQVSSFDGDLVSLDFSRGDIRNQVWKRVYSIWDPDWKSSNTEQVFAVYEDDTKGTKTLSGSLNATVNFPGTPSRGKSVGEISYKVEVSTQDEIITQRKFDRASFLRDGMNAQGWGYLHDDQDFLPDQQDWPIYDGASVWQYSMAWKIY